MLTPEFAQELKSVAYKLIALATGEAGTGGTEPAAPDVVPDGYVLVRPTGIRSGGAARLWPKVWSPGMHFFTYMFNLGQRTRPDGTPYLTDQARGQMTLLMQPGTAPTAEEDFYWFADAFCYPDQWRTQEQWDQIAADQAAWKPVHDAIGGGQDGEVINLGG